MALRETQGLLVTGLSHLSMAASPGAQPATEEDEDLQLQKALQVMPGLPSYFLLWIPTSCLHIQAWKVVTHPPFIPWKTEGEVNCLPL